MPTDHHRNSNELERMVAKLSLIIKLINKKIQATHNLYLYLTSLLYLELYMRGNGRNEGEMFGQQWWGHHFVAHKGADLMKCFASRHRE